MPEEDVWYFTAQLRLEGKELLQRGNMLDDDRRTLEAEAAVKIHKIEGDLDEYVTAREKELERERKVFEGRVAQQNDRINLDIELRQEELAKVKEEKKKEFAVIERKAREEFGAAPTQMMQLHRNQILDLESMMVTEKANMEKYRDDEEREARVMFGRSETIKLTEIEKRRTAASENTSRIRQEVAGKVKAAEAEWQFGSNKWLTVARRKVQVKKKEDEEARAGKKKRKV